MADAFGPALPEPHHVSRHLVARYEVPETIPPPIAGPERTTAPDRPGLAPVERAARHVGMVMLGCTAALVWALLAATWVLVR